MHAHANWYFHRIYKKKSSFLLLAVLFKSAEYWTKLRGTAEILTTLYFGLNYSPQLDNFPPPRGQHLEIRNTFWAAAGCTVVHKKKSRNSFLSYFLFFPRRNASCICAHIFFQYIGGEKVAHCIVILLLDTHKMPFCLLIKHWFGPTLQQACRAFSI